MSAPPSPRVETRVEALRRVVTARTDTTTWEFSVWEDWPDGEPRIRDTDAAARLSFSRPRDIRPLIERTWPENKRPNCRDTVSRQSTGNGASREYTVTEYWLTEAELLKLCARARTEVAESILDEMIATYIAVRRHLLTTVHVAAHDRKLPAPKTLSLPAPLPPPLPCYGDEPTFPAIVQAAMKRRPEVAAWVWSRLATLPLVTTPPLTLAVVVGLAEYLELYAVPPDDAR